MKHIIIILLASLVAGCASTSKAPLPDSLQETDSVVVMRIESRKPAKVAIFNCTVEKTIHGPQVPNLITMSFLHFPDCQRLSVGTRYLCAVRPGSGTSYTLIRSDMLTQGNERDLRTCAWEADSPEAKQVTNEIERHNK